MIEFPFLGETIPLKITWKQLENDSKAVFSDKEDLMFPFCSSQVYKILVKRAPEESWHIFRRYTDFSRLHDKVRHR